MITGNFANIRKNLEEKVHKKAEFVVNSALLHMTDELMSRSPVGQDELWSTPAPPDYKPGYYKANWQHSVNTPISTTVQEYDDSFEQGRCDTYDKLEVSIKQNKQLSTKHFFVNNVDYALQIEHGWAIHNPRATTNIPHAVAGLTAQNFNKHVKNAVKEARIIG